MIKPLMFRLGWVRASEADRRITLAYEIGFKDGVYHETRPSIDNIMAIDRIVREAQDA